ncbi:Lipoate-protein ligase B [Nitrosococcus oceani ATCC 19707]|uniref:Octanoyltransferase n=2 Tax=Nitrosococcus oceani TaxID=1229 RepID=LIPB_NITOC|nr:lipoyl(octanoyl) transferase LipB [Nitrosococcus oceani]Q3J7W3.1 RecName: Full=Octanoyltransferase; AltName: Full=Lipoate-protein ligase B; AltName: Full=Lipoyl/octanoyl transferase; AltName: Full=Octanoyl-[acyl-carrier-protein]-protein N-octanoyltransferase [Nitrosococcus oceani ATCC 19707]ABA59083.1 Lipoate-protein ligase B [Nitrosococcus oceani ATCC 19707]KFI18507.1 lipoate--protein ligase [Nitrosococcus oceani C-27]
MDKRIPVGADTLRIRNLGLQDYDTVWQAMRDFTVRRDSATVDELWWVEHPPVFTLGLNGQECHLRDVGDIPVVRCDRGGQVTYHGPGQSIVYILVDLRRRALGVRQLVDALELSVVDLLQSYEIETERRANAPGVYVQGRKIASLGLRVRKGCCYHGLSLNVAMDLSPFYRIDPCGYSGMEVIDLKRLGMELPLADVQQNLSRYLVRRLGYSAPFYGEENRMIK